MFIYEGVERRFMKLIKVNFFKAFLPIFGICYKKVNGKIVVTGFYKKVF